MFKSICTVILTGIALTGISTGSHAEVWKDISSLQWLTGDYFSQQGNDVTEISYSTPRAGMVMGMIRVTSGSAVTFFEFQRIEEKNGTLVLSPSPYGQPGVSFTLAAAGDEQVSFENPQHDFPRKITLAMNPDGSLLMRVEGQKDGHDMSQQFSVPRK